MTHHKTYLASQYSLNSARRSYDSPQEENNSESPSVLRSQQPQGDTPIKSGLERFLARYPNWARDTMGNETFPKSSAVSLRMNQRRGA